MWITKVDKLGKTGKNVCVDFFCGFFCALCTVCLFESAGGEDIRSLSPRCRMSILILAGTLSLHCARSGTKLAGQLLPYLLAKGRRAQRVLGGDIFIQAFQYLIRFYKNEKKLLAKQHMP